MPKYAFALALILAAAPAFAQSGSTQSPPSPNAATSAPTPATSAPAPEFAGQPEHRRPGRRHIDQRRAGDDRRLPARRRDHGNGAHASGQVMPAAR